MDNGLETADLRLAQRLADLRQQQGWSLEALAQRTGLSRATLSRVERTETSPTASLLNRLCAAYGLTMSRLLSEIEDEPPELLRPPQQPVWVDRASGFHRRSVSPPAALYKAEFIEARLDAGAQIDRLRPAVDSGAGASPLAAVRAAGADAGRACFPAVARRLSALPPVRRFPFPCPRR